MVYVHVYVYYNLCIRHHLLHNSHACACMRCRVYPLVCSLLLGSRVSPVLTCSCFATTGQCSIGCSLFVWLGNPGQAAKTQQRLHFLCGISTSCAVAALTVWCRHSLCSGSTSCVAVELLVWRLHFLCGGGTYHALHRRHFP